MARTLRVAVIGAGIGGLAAACAVRQRGFDIAVYERAPELGEVGAGLQLGPNAVKVLRAPGVADALKRLAFEPVNIVSLAWDDARLRFREPLKAVAAAKFGAPYWTAHRADVHRLLCETLPAVRLAAHCTRASSASGGAVAGFADGTEIEADVIIGADGINSAVRESLFGLQPARYTQQMAWRCIVPIACVPTRVGPGVEISRDEYVGWIGPDGHVICYPIRCGEIYNIFAGHVSEQWVDESWVVPSSVAELLAGYRGWNEALLEILQAYEAERLPRARAVQLQARQQFQNNRKNPAPPPLSRDWIFAHDATVDATADALAQN